MTLGRTLAIWAKSVQKQPPRGAPRKRCSENMQQIYRRTPMPKCEHPFHRKRHTGIPGPWTQELDAGLWSLDSGRWTLDAGLWTLDSGRWTLDAGLWTLDSGR